MDQRYLVVTDAQVEAARLLMEMNAEDGTETDEAIRAIAAAEPLRRGINGTPVTTRWVRQHPLPEGSAEPERPEGQPQP